MSKHCLFLVFLFCLSSQIAFSQGGLYRTYDDYFNDNVEKEFDYGGHIVRGAKNFKVVYKDFEGNTYKFAPKQKAYWGYRSKGNIYRIGDMNVPYWRIVVGDICVYLISDAVPWHDGSYTFDLTRYTPKYSVGTNGPLTSISKKNLKVLFRGDAEWEHKLKKTPFGIEPLYELLMEYINR